MIFTKMCHVKLMLALNTEFSLKTVLLDILRYQNSRPNNTYVTVVNCCRFLTTTVMRTLPLVNLEPDPSCTETMV